MLTQDTKIAFRTKTQRLCVLALMATFSLIIFVVESQIPVPIAIPGIKLGLANVITLFMLKRFSVKDTAYVLSVRIVLASIFAGQGMYLAYSVAGGFLAFAAMVLFLKASKGENLWFAGVLGAISHNLGQILVAIFFFQTGYVAYYFVVLTFCGIVTGLFTGITAQLASKYRIK